MSNFIPNSYQTPNMYVDRLMPLLTPSEWMVLSYMARRIFGFQKASDQISLSQLEHGIKSKATGKQLDYGTGLGRSTIITALADLTEFNVIIQTSPAVKELQQAPEWALQTDDKKVDWEGLQLRRDASKVTRRRQTRKARKTKAEQQATDGKEASLLDRPALVSSTDQPPPSLLDRPALVSSTDQPSSVRQTSPSLLDRQTITSRNPVEIQGENQIIIDHVSTTGKEGSIDDDLASTHVSGGSSQALTAVPETESAASPSGAVPDSGKSGISSHSDNKACGKSTGGGSGATAADTDQLGQAGGILRAGQGAFTDDDLIDDDWVGEPEYDLLVAKLKQRIANKTVDHSVLGWLFGTYGAAPLDNVIDRIPEGTRIGSWASYLPNAVAAEAKALANDVERKRLIEEAGEDGEEARRRRYAPDEYADVIIH